jgi:hypothetical protein
MSKTKKKPRYNSGSANCDDLPLFISKSSESISITDSCTLNRISVLLSIDTLKYDITNDLVKYSEFYKNISNKTYEKNYYARQARCDLYSEFTGEQCTPKNRYPMYPWKDNYLL